MAEEEHESKKESITIKKDTLWKFGTLLFAILFVVALFTGGFGLAVANGNATANTGGTTATTGTTAVDLTPFTQNAQLYPSLGPSNAKTTVVEVADFQCPYCALASGLPNWTAQYQSQYGDLINAAGNIEKMAQNGQLKFIFVPMSFLGQESIWAAQAAYCAADQNASFFWKMHDAIYAASTGPQEDTGKYSIPNLEKIASGISGLDQAKFNSCLQNNDTLSMVQSATSQAGNIATGTPTFYVNGKQVSASSTALNAAIGA